MFSYGAPPTDDEGQRQEHPSEAWRQPNRGGGAGSFAFADPRVGTRRGVPVRRDDAQAGKGSAEEDAIVTLEKKITARYTDERSSTRGMDTVVEKMFTMGVFDESGVQTKFITHKKPRKFLRLKTKSIHEPDFMLVLSNETIKQVASSLQRRDQPDNVGSAKAQRYLEPDWNSFRENTAFKFLTEYKDNAFRPELPDGLPEKRDIEHRIDVKEPNLAMYRQQWRQSPEQQHEIERWVEDMHPNDKEGIHFGRNVWCIMVFNDGPDVRVLSICKPPATMSFYDDIYIFTKSTKIEDHLEALRGTLDILRNNKLYVKLSKCVFCASEIPCLGDFVGCNGVRMDPDKVQTIKD
ncbi:unnamed protein product [Phytophthora fragariaefolia]|uniref:Unnamed protein product n=1 Tax=Phytophthora fragariaefolia TaxID=1490495 RepID=A0A9W7CNZ7_9STRA|nr:unnamed protein product [Phytophthora fragariaefolia]